MSLLDQDIPSGVHTCSRCNILFGQGTRARHHSHDLDRSLHNDGPRRITVYINPSKRPYIAPFRRVQTLERLLQYVSTLPHPQIRFVTNTNSTKPAFRACEEMLFGGQWQLVDRSGCIIRPEDYEELVHDGMDITLDTIPYDQIQVPEEAIPVLQPMAISGGKAAREGLQIERNEVAGDLLDIHMGPVEPMAAQHQHTQSEASVAQYHTGGFVPMQEEAYDVNELEGEENPEPQVPSFKPFIMPPKPSKSWTFGSQAGIMSASAMEFRPGALLQGSGAPAESPIAQIQQAVRKRSMAIPIIKPPTPPPTAIAAPKPGLLDSHVSNRREPIENNGDGGWTGRVAVTADAVETQHEEEHSKFKSEETHKWEDAELEPTIREPDVEKSQVVEDVELKPKDFEPEEELESAPAGEQHLNEDRCTKYLGLPTDFSEIASVSSIGPDPVLKCGENHETNRSSPLHSGRNSPGHGERLRNAVEDPVEETLGSENKFEDSETFGPQDQFEEESHLFDDDVPGPNENADVKEEKIPKEEIEEPVPASRPSTPEKGHVPTQNPSSSKLLAALMSGNEFRPSFEMKPQSADTGFKWDEDVGNVQFEEPEASIEEEAPIEEASQEELQSDKPEEQAEPPYEPELGNQRPEHTDEELDQGLNPTANSWETSTWDSGVQETVNGGGWGDWSTSQSAVVDDSQWDNRGHVRRDSEGDDEWGPSKPKKQEYVEAPKPSRPAWGGSGRMNQSSWASGPAVETVAPTRPPRPQKKGMSLKNPNTGQQIELPPRPGSKGNEGHMPFNKHQKQGSLPKYIHFLPSPNTHQPHPKPNKLSFAGTTTVRKLAQSYARFFKEPRLLSVAGNFGYQPIFEFTVSKTEDGAVTTFNVEADRKLQDYDFGSNEFWVSVVQSGSQGNKNNVWRREE